MFDEEAAVPPDRRRLIVAAPSKSEARAEARRLAQLLWAQLSVLTVANVILLNPDDPLLDDWQPATGRPNQTPHDLTGPHWMTTIHTRGRPGTWWAIDDE